MSNTAAVDVAVIGGGAIGLAVAWRAAQRGMDVCVLEAGAAPAAGASSVAAGMLGPVCEAEFGAAGRALLELGSSSARRWPAFAAELEAACGAAVGWRESGTLMVARDGDEAEALERELAFRAGLGLEVRRLRGSDARRLEPALAPGVRMAIEAPADHSVDPPALTGALAAAARSCGARVRTSARVARVVLASTASGEQRVAGVELDDGEHLAAGRTVVAAGAWSGVLPGLPDRAGVPVRPVKGQILRLRDPAGPGLVARVLRCEGAYVVPREDGRYVLGATVEERGFDTAVTAGGARELLREGRELLPGIDEMVLEQCSASLRPGTPDNLPVVGPGALDGLHWCTGHYRNGILLCPLTADALVESWVGAADGPSAAMLESLRPDRFASQPMPLVGAIA